MIMIDRLGVYHHVNTEKSIYTNCRREIPAEVAKDTINGLGMAHFLHISNLHCNILNSRPPPPLGLIDIKFDIFLMRI